MTHAAQRPPIEALTPRQREVLALLERGLTNEEIAAELGISLDGAKWHVSEILGKLDVRSRHQAASRWGAAWLAAPLLGLKKLKLGALAYAAGAAVTAGAAIGAGLLIWGAVNTNFDADDQSVVVPATAAPTAPPAIATQPYENPAFDASLAIPASWVPDPDYGGSFGGVASSYADPAGRERGYVLLNAMSADSFEAAVDSVAHHKLQPFGVNPIVRDFESPAGTGKLILPDPQRPDIRDAAFILPYAEPITIDGAGGPYAYLSVDAHVDFIESILATLRFAN